MAAARRASGRVALVTGAARGIGWASANALAEQGYSVGIADIDEAAAHRAARELSAKTEAAGFGCDVSKKVEVDNLFRQMVSTFGGLDTLVSNAGIVRAGDYATMTEQDFDDVIGVHVKGTFLCGQAAARLFQKQNEAAPGRGGAIINMSSIAAAQASPEVVAYHAAKGAIDSLTRGQAIALAPQGVRVNAVGPGAIRTELLQHVSEQDPKFLPMWLSRIPLRRLGLPEEVGKVVAFLASDAASYVTGQTIYVEGGMLSLSATVDPPQQPEPA